MDRPFYKENSLSLCVLNSNTLQLNTPTGVRDTDYIELPSIHHSNDEREKFRFRVVNYDEHLDQIEFGLWIYAFHPSFNYKIQGCTFRVVTGLNTIALPPTIDSDSVVGVYRSPCYEILSNDTTIDVLIHFPNMEFQTSDGNVSTIQMERNNDATVVARTDELETTSKIKEVNLSHDLSTAIKEMMNSTDYDVYFVVDGKKIGTFKFALCAVSDVFRATFKDHTKESRSGEIVIDDFGYNAVQMFVDAVHKHRVDFNDDPVMTLQLGMLANKYNVACIEKAASDAFNVMDVNRHNFVNLYRLAAFDNGIMNRLMQRFIEMRMDTDDIVGFDELTDKMKIEFYRSAHWKTIGK